MTATNPESAASAANDVPKPLDSLADVSRWEPAADMPDPSDRRLRPALDERMLREIGRRAVCREFAPGEVLFEQGQRNAPFFVIERGSVVYFDRGRDQGPGGRHTYFARAGAGMFIGDVSMFTGEPTIAECRAQDQTNVMVLERGQLRELLAQHPEIGDVVLRAMLARREWLEQHEYGTVKVLGSRWNPQAFRLRDFLSRNSVPHRWYDVDADPAAAVLLKELGVAPEDTPVLVCGGSVCRNPSIEEVAAELGLRPEPDGHTYDLLVIGAGPAGLAAAVYAASEGLSTFVADAESPGGQAGTSSRIENYLGFPLGVSGGELARARRPPGQQVRRHPLRPEVRRPPGVRRRAQGRVLLRRGPRRGAGRRCGHRRQVPPARGRGVRRLRRLRRLLRRQPHRGPQLRR